MEGGTFIVKAAPERLPDNCATIIHARGSTYFAAVRTIQELMPSPKEAKRAVVIIRLGEMDEIGSTMISVIER